MTAPSPPEAHAEPAPSTPPSLLRCTLLGIAIAVGVGATVFFLIAIPFYTLASFEANGIDRPIIRTGLFRISLPVGAIVGLISGIVAGRWFRQGGRWTMGHGGDRYSNR